MSTAESLPDNIRRIAVLVASVDSATAQQLLLHLPTSIAKQVRRALQNLGPVSPSERQRILAEFQSTAARQNQTPAPAASTQIPSMQQPGHFAQPSHYSASPNTNAPLSPHQHLQSQAYAPSLAEHSERGGSPLYSASSASDDSLPSWKRMDIRALSHFLRNERAIVVAVVINQLSPDTGVSLLQQLPVNMHREVLQAIATLQDIDEEAMHSIEEHLAERIKDYEQQVNGEAKGTRRVAALLAAAPPELQETWSRFMHIAIDPSNGTQEIQAGSTQASVSQANSATRNQLPSDLNQPTPAARTAASATSQSTVIDTKTNATATRADVSRDVSRDDEEPYIIPFPGPNDPLQLSNTDRSLIQIEFEQILTLSAHQLAQVLTAADSHTVLLALAGASPSFMKQFYALLTKSDAKALASRLGKIGPLKLRDIDEAQRSISELAAKLVSPSAHRASRLKSARVAA